MLIYDCVRLFVSCTQGESKMSGTENNDLKEQELAENAHKIQVDGDKPEEGLNSMEKSDDNPMPSPQQEVYYCFCINFQFDFGYKKQGFYSTLDYSIVRFELNWMTCLLEN